MIGNTLLLQKKRLEFLFKQFKIIQNDSVFKIGTDSIILGSWVNFEKASNILDVGCGTGLLSLMAAQREIKANVLGIDLQKEATNLSHLNFQNAPFSDRLKVVNEHFIQFSNTSNLKFDYIISNPPYFSSGEASKQRNLGIARHNSALPIIEFWNCVNKISSKSTKVGLIYPYAEAQICIINAMEMGWNVHRRLNIYPKETEINGMNPKRVALEFSKKNLPFEVEDLFILAKNGHYTKAYKDLTKDFYL